ncbi:MAG: hypothetical protein KatS3mg129_1017 [Leptospiraceae bacterium]|nr:MAG: hypothetical protein KatS3mg129_1017 [Leptospiraceae bacterium]
MKNKIIFTFIIASILNCFENKDEGLRREFYLMYVLPAIQDMQRDAANICNHLDTLEELSPSNTYEFYNKQKIIRKIPYFGKGVQIYLEVLKPDREARYWIFSCQQHGLFYTQTVSDKIETSGGIISSGWKVATLGNPLTIKYWEVSYRYYIFYVFINELNGYGDYPTDFRVAISEL